jgi:CubicO group peptidase (beta-lactamase class C family)
LYCSASDKGENATFVGKGISMRSSLRTAAVLLSVLLAAGSARAAAPETAALDALMEQALAVWKPPGLAVAVVRDGEVLYLRGLGVREVGKEGAVTPDTLFAVGSLTKAFTATAVGLLVEDGKAKWDDPVRQHVPFFRLSDPLADRDVTLRDLLCHRTGLARHDLLWYHAPWPVEETVRRAAHLEPAAPFRATYLYNNVAYLTAGLAVGSASGMPWQDFVRARLLEPLGMKRTVFTRSELEKVGDFALPHRRTLEGRNEPFAWWNDDRQVRASGAIKSSVRDLAQWLRVQLDEGKLGNRQVLPRGSLAETHAAQVVVPLDAERARLVGTTQRSYGLGWHLSDYRGRLLWEHGGAVDGFRARILLLPREHLGIVVLTNLEEVGIVQATGNTLLDHFLKAADHDWHRYYLARASSPAEQLRRRLERQDRERVSGTKPSHERAEYAGAYRDPAYGEVRIAQADGRLTLVWSGFRGPLEHHHYDTFRVRDESRIGGELVVFRLDAGGKVGGLRFLGREFRR